MKSVLTLLLVTLLCTGVRAQTDTGKLPRDLTNVAFIKGSTGFLIDSFTIRTSLDTFPYGFSFKQDTIVLDISVFKMVDELTLETFAGELSFGRNNCWIDAPSANVYLSIAAGQTMIDSVGLSPMDNWFRREVRKVKAVPYLNLAKDALKSSILASRGTLMVTKFIEAFFELPNLTRSDIVWLQATINQELTRPVKLHPWFSPLLTRQKIMQSKLPRRLRKYPLIDQDGKVVEVRAPKRQLYVLDFYDARTTASRRDHERLRDIMQTDSVFAGVPVISITRGDYVAGWRNYVTEGSFPWPHYREPSPATGPGLFEELAFFPASTYLLVNENNRIEGVYDNLRRLMSAVGLRKQGRLR